MRFRSRARTAAALALAALAGGWAASRALAAPGGPPPAGALAGLFSTPAQQAALTARAIAFYEPRVAGDPRAAADRASLAGLYLQRARETGDYGDVLRGERMARASLAIRGRANHKAVRQLAASLLAQHRFGEAAAVARELVRTWPEDPAHRALLAEAQMELGDYAAAEVTLGSIRHLHDNLAVAPRLARWEELHGRPDRARALFAAALRRAVYRTDFTGEQVAWYHLRLGDLALRTGDLRAAEAAFRDGLRIAPGDYRLLAATARLHAARGEWQRAAEAGEEAVATVLDPGTLGLVSEAYAALGDAERAREYATAMRVAVKGQAGALHREWSLFLLDHGGDARAVAERARTELAERRDVYGHDLLAWALYRAGRPAEAAPHAAAALRLGTRDPLLLYHAGMIQQALGNREAARRHLRAALKLNPRFHPRHAPEARAAVAALGGRFPGLPF